MAAQQDQLNAPSKIECDGEADIEPPAMPPGQFKCVFVLMFMAEVL
jgi:hypothetical protein